MAPRPTEALSERGLRATFDLPSGAFHISVRLSDGSEHLVDARGRRFNNSDRTIRRYTGELTPLGVKTN